MIVITQVWEENVFIGLHVEGRRKEKDPEESLSKKDLDQGRQTQPLYDVRILTI